MTQPCSGDLASFLQEARPRVLIDGDLAPHLSSASVSAVGRGSENRVETSLPACDGLGSHSNGGEVLGPGLRSQQAYCPLIGS